MIAHSASLSSGSSRQRPLRYPNVSRVMDALLLVDQHRSKVHHISMPRPHCERPQGLYSRPKETVQPVSNDRQRCGDLCSAHHIFYSKMSPERRQALGRLRTLQSRDNRIFWGDIAFRVRTANPSVRNCTLANSATSTRYSKIWTWGSLREDWQAMSS